MTTADGPAGTALPRIEVSLARAATAVWKRPARAATMLPPVTTSLGQWRPDPRRMAVYRDLLGTSAHLPVGFPQLAITALQLGLLSAWSFPVRLVGLIHPGFVVEVLEELPTDQPWDLHAWVSGCRHVRSGLEFDLCGEVSVARRVCWRSTAITLSRSRSAAGAHGSAVPELDVRGPWERQVPLDVPSGTGRAFARVSGDVNPIHLHPVGARMLGLRRPIAHGWWTAGRVAALLGVDETLPGRTLEIAFRRPVELPSTPTLCSNVDRGAVVFALMPEPLAGTANERARPLVLGRVTGGLAGRPDSAELRPTGR